MDPTDEKNWPGFVAPTTTFEGWDSVPPGEPYFGLDRTRPVARTVPRRGLRERLADVWRGLVNGWRGYL